MMGMKRLLKIFALLVSLAGFSLWGGNACAVTCTSIAAGGNWNAAGTWTGCAGGMMAGAPGSNDTAIIATTGANVVTANVAITVGNVIINSGGTLAIAGSNWTVNGTTDVSGTLSHTNTGGSETYIGLVTINAGGVWDNNIGESITFQGGIIHNGASFTSGTLAANGRMTFNTNNQTIGGTSAINFVRARVSGAITVTNNNTNIVTVIGTLDGTAAGSTWVNGANATVNYSNVTVPMATAGVLTATAAGNTFNYTGAAQTVKLPSGATYYHLTLSGSGIKTMPATAMTVAGNFTMSGTATATAAQVLTVGGNFTIGASNTFAAGAFAHSVGGNWSNSGTFTANTSTVTFNGTAAQTIGGAATTTFNNLKINNASGVTLGNSPTVSGLLTLTNGIMTTGANTLEVTSNCTTGISAGGAATYVQGNLTLHYPTNAGTTTCTFPIGSAAAYSPATVAMLNVSSTLANSSLTARTDAGDHADTTANLSGVDAAKSVNRYWTLTPGGSLTFATYNTTFTFVAGDIDGGAIPANFIISRKNSGVWSYPTTGAANALSTTATGMTQAGGFGGFVIGERTFPALTILKSVAVYSDPVNGTINPKNIPGSEVLYTLIVTNSGAGTVDNNTLVIIDPIPANTELFTGNLSGGAPFVFVDGALSSGLTCTFTALNNFADCVDFSNNGGATWTYVPNGGFDPAVTHIRFSPAGSMSGDAVAGSPSPNFGLSFRVRVK